MNEKEFTYTLDPAWEINPKAQIDLENEWKRSYNAMIRKLVGACDTPDEEKNERPEEWIWVDGYKGTDENMKCRGYQFTLGSKYDMPEDAEIRNCHSGFHLCKELKDVFRYYEIGKGHRFFKVSALVRKSDSEKYGKTTFFERQDKLASKSILFTRELTPDEVFAHTEHADWSEEEKKEAMRTSIDAVKSARKVKTLVDLGYSEPFAKYVINQGYYDAAVAVSSQTDLSMDMKIVAILEM